ncbi:serine/threonine-protein kinase nekl-2 [Myripristis murdjan]|uniref:serine/threonine-protein kinase nekl-2 n=1 Tax=Myripristis murdjan TaxID=586833 RepID=UPI0011761C20|nr:serine/threonine-protein kinase nekl-2-like [Myripristis murdjan]
MAYSTGTIAAGCFGKVYKEKYNDTWAAIKRVPHQLISRKDLERECDVYNKAEHPNIVKLLGNITLKDGKWVIPLEFIFGEDLETTIFKAAKSKIQLTPANKGKIIIGMCEGLLHLHSKDIVHQDLKPENIMVEHNTNRAVIIDLGLAKFFRNGLNSAMDMGNEAYSAPEVLQRGNQRSQRSDVWAMGKIIAELCARIRLHTPSVCPAKIKETLRDQPYCHAVCRMVESNPSLRASMAGVMSDIRRAGGGGITAGPPPKDHLQPPAPRTNIRDPSPSRFNRDPSPLNRRPSPLERSPSPFKRDLSPMNRGPSPLNRDLSPMNRGPSPLNRDLSPMNRGPSPLDRSPSPLKWDRAPSPKPGTAALRPQAAVHRPLSPHLTEGRDKDKSQAVVPAGKAGLSEDFMKMMLYQEASKDLPCGLPTTGMVRVRRYEEKNGEVETWEQKEVVTKGGRIVKYDNVKFNSN